MSYPIPFVTREHLEEPSPRAGLRCFPFASGRWVTHTAQVVSIEIVKGRLTDFLVVKGRNGQHGVRISVSLEPSYAPNANGQDKDQLTAKNTERLVRILKAFGLAVFDDGGAWLEPVRFDSAVGEVFSFSIIGATEDGLPKYNDRGHQRTYVAFRGLAPMLLPVAVPDDAADEKQVNSCALNIGNALALYDGDVA